MAKASIIYFIQAGKGGPIKIGRCIDIMRRMGELQIGSWADLDLLHSFDGHSDMEGMLHEYLESHNIRGEWFHPHDDVIAAVDALKAGDIDAFFENVAEKFRNSDRIGEESRRAAAVAAMHGPLIFKPRGSRAHV